MLVAQAPWTRRQWLRCTWHVGAAAAGAALLAGCAGQTGSRAYLAPSNQPTMWDVVAATPMIPATTPMPAPAATVSPDMALPVMTSTPLSPTSATNTARATPVTGATTSIAPAQDTAVWQAVAQGVNQTISPLLKPTVLPMGLTTVQLLAVQPGAFQVEYRGAGQRLRVCVGKLNPPPGIGQVPLLVRGQQVALVLHPADSPHGSDWLTWREPGRWLPPEVSRAEPFVEYFVFANGLSPAEVQQVLERLTPVAPPPPSASPGNGNAAAVASLESAIGGIALGVNGATVLRVLGQPAVRTAAHGMGTPEWQYANGLTVQLTDPHNPASPDTVWEISAQLPFAGATATGFRLGDSETQCRKAYQGSTTTAPQVRQLQIEAADGTLLGVLFDPNGKATMLTFSSQRSLCPNCTSVTNRQAATDAPTVSWSP